MVSIFSSKSRQWKQISVFPKTSNYSFNIKFWRRVSFFENRNSWWSKNAGVALIVEHVQLIKWPKMQWHEVRLWIWALRPTFVATQTFYLWSPWVSYRLGKHHENHLTTCRNTSCISYASLCLWSCTISLIFPASWTDTYNPSNQTQLRPLFSACIFTPRPPPPFSKSSVLSAAILRSLFPPPSLLWVRLVIRRQAGHAHVPVQLCF